MRNFGILLLTLLLFSCRETKVYTVELNSGKTYMVKSTGYYVWSDFIGFREKAGIFPKDSVKSITVK